MHLLRSRRFLPLFVTQALGALVDNLFRNAIVVLVIFDDPAAGASLVALAGGVFILPYVLFSALAGKLADRHDKARLIRITKSSEFVVMALAGAALLSGSHAAMLAVLFGLGIQATFFGPLKYAILPDHLAADDLLAGNALIEAGTFAAILVGTSVGGVLAARQGGAAWAAGGGLVVSAAGLVAAWFVPPAPPVAVAGGTAGGWNLAGDTMRLVVEARANRTGWICTLGISWFWTLGAVLLAQLPVVGARVLAANGQVVTLLVSMFTLGIGVGSLLAGRLVPRAVNGLARNGRLPRAVLWSGLGMTLACLDFAWATTQASPALGWHDVPALLGAAGGWRLLGDLLVVAGCGGIFSVPLYALLQASAAPGHRARGIAASNVLNALCMAAGSAVAAILPLAGLGPAGIVAVAALVNGGVVAGLARTRPPSGNA